MTLKFADLTLDPNEMADTVAAITRVIERGAFVLGPEVDAFERELAAEVGVAHAVGVASGTDALILGLRSIGIGPGDEVIVPAFTAFPTVAAVLESGATPVLVDVEAERPFLDLAATLDAVSERTKAVLLVHLYGCAADARAFEDALATVPHVVLVEDCAQAHGAQLPSGEPVGSVGRFATISFYPTKVLGALGDGGALVTNDSTLADQAHSWRNHGERGVRFVHHLPARNSRLDEIQAAVLRTRLRSMPRRLDLLRDLSDRYDASLADVVDYVWHGRHGAPHLAVIRTAEPSPDDLATRLEHLGIPTRRHYPFALSDQPVLAAHSPADVPHARSWAATCLSLPLHAHMSPSDIDLISSTVAAHVRSAPHR